MRRGIAEPSDIKRIFDKPGRRWSLEEQVRVKEWLYELEQLRHLLCFVLSHLGQTAIAEDAEDAWENFRLRRLDTHIDLYDPARGRRFWNFLLFCLARFCWEEGKRITRRGRRESSVEVHIQIGDGKAVDLEWPDLDPEGAPEEVLENKEKLDALRRCLETLSDGYHTIIRMHYFEETPITKISATLKISESNAKVRLYRARQQLAQCLEKEGEAP